MTVFWKVFYVASISILVCFLLMMAFTYLGGGLHHETDASFTLRLFVALLFSIFVGLVLAYSITRMNGSD